MDRRRGQLVCYALGYFPEFEIPPLNAALAYFAPCPRGLEGVLAGELEPLGASRLRTVPGGIHFTGSIEVGYRANLWSRTASRILRRVTSATYRSEDDLYRLARGIAWSKWFEVDRAIRVDVTAIRSPLRSLEFATLRVKDAVCDRFRDDTGRRPNVDTRAPDVRLSVFLTDTEATLYLDTSGEALFKRGFRADAGSAPLKENLAAGIILLTGWSPGETFFDPMCGSGTFAIEAAMIARGRAPGISRPFAFERLADFDAGLWDRLRDEARRAERPSSGGRIVASDINPREVERARYIARGTGLADSITFDVGDVLEVTPPEPPGVLLANPPYGVRVAEQSTLEAFYPKLGAALKARYAGWRCYFFTADLGMPKAVRLKESRRTPLFNGALECRLFEFKMVAGSNRGAPSGR